MNNQPPHDPERSPQVGPGQHQHRINVTPTGGAPGYRIRAVKSLPAGGQIMDLVYDESQAAVCVWDGTQWVCWPTSGHSCWDYVVACDGTGTHDTVRDMMADFMAAAAADTNVVKTCLICCEDNEDTNIPIGSNSSSVGSATLIMVGLEGGFGGQRHALSGIIGATNDAFFKVTVGSPSYTPHLVLKRLQLNTRTAGGAIETGVAHGFIYTNVTAGHNGYDFYDCGFLIGVPANNSNGIIVRAADATVGDPMAVRFYRCEGNAGDLYNYRSGVIVGSLEVYDCHLFLRHLVQNDDSSALDTLILSGGGITCASYFFNHVAGSNLLVYIKGNITLVQQSTTNAFRLASGQIASEPGALRFVVQGGVYYVHTQPTGGFATLGASGVGSTQDTIYINDLYGRCDETGTNPGAMITIGSGWDNVFLGFIVADRWATAISGGTSLGQSIADHLADPTDAHDASAVSVVPAGTIAATTVQAAIVELDGDVQGHITDPTDAHPASSVGIVDAGGFFTGADVEAALQELGIGGGGADPWQIIDGDGDTHVRTEPSAGADGDVIEATSAGVVRARLSALGLQLANATNFEVYSDAFTTLWASIAGTNGNALLAGQFSVTRESASVIVLGVEGASGGRQFRFEFPDITTEDGLLRALRTTNTTGNAELAVYRGDGTSTQMLSIARLSTGVLRGYFTGYWRVGSSTTPQNPNAGDLTATRLIVPDAALADTDLITQLGGPVGIRSLGVQRYYNAANTGYVGLRGPATPHATKFVYVLPADAPAPGERLVVLSIGGSPAITTEWANYDATQLTNATGANTVLNEAVLIDTAADSSFVKPGAAAQSTRIAGVVAEAGIANGSLCLIAHSGVIDVLCETAGAVARGDLLEYSPTAGRVRTAAAPVIGGILGKALTAKAAATIGSVRCLLTH